MPLLGLMPALAEGKAVAERDEIIRRADRLKAELPMMIEEHKAIVIALQKLAAAAKKENKLVQLQFTERLMLHAQNEEEILYPAAVVVGEYLRLRS